MGFFGDLFGLIFGTKNDDSKKQNPASMNVNQSAGAYTVSRLMSDLGVDRPTINSYMRENNIVPVNDTLTQNQVDRIYDSRLRHQAEENSPQTRITSQNSRNEDKAAVDKNSGSPAQPQITPPTASPYSLHKAGRKSEKILPSQIIADYDLSPSDGQRKYVGKKVLFIGKVHSAVRDRTRLTINMFPADKNFRGMIVCEIADPSSPPIQQSKLKQGKKIAVEGYIADVRLNYQDDRITLVGSCILFSHKITVQEITNIPDTVIKRSKIPAGNDQVYNPNGQKYTLTRFIASGGEGSIYAIDTPGKIAKIYNEAHCTIRVREKIKLMVESHLNFEGICFPLEILNNAYGEFCGFIMSEAKGRTLSSLFIPQREFEKTFPGWKKIDLVKLSISILRKIKYLHEHDVIMGDISPFNIMFVSPEEVYFIDTDSYQFGSFPCRVGTNNFVAPELLGKNLSTLMRTQGNENFAVATLLFMLMMQGKQPYSHQGGSQSAEDVKAGIFPYGAGKRTVPGNVWELQPVGLWRYIWSHLTLKLKEAFIDTFRQDGRNNKESTRFNADKWLTLMEKYIAALPYAMTQDDPMSTEIFPTREKRGKDINYRVCSVCGEEQPEDLFYDQTTCRACHSEQRRQIEEHRRQPYTTLTCTDCGQTFIVTNGEYEYYSSKGYSLPKRCESCRKKTRVCSQCGKEKPSRMFHDQSTCKECYNSYRNSIYGTYWCSDCGRSFTITNGEYEFYTSRGFDIPKRCPSCRGTKKGY